MSAITIRPRRILVVDDQRDICHILTTVLTAAGHRVASAADGLSAVALADEFVPEVVICDLNLDSAMDGWAVAHALRTDARLAGIHLIALTGSRPPSGHGENAIAEFAHYLRKPVDGSVLLRLLEELP